jgi:hypothetical protein
MVFDWAKNLSQKGRRPLQRPMDRGLETAPTSFGIDSKYLTVRRVKCFYVWFLAR